MILKAHQKQIKALYKPAIAVLLSALVPLFLLLEFSGTNGGSALGKGAFATLILDESQDDEEACKRLLAAGIGSVFSSSSEWAYINNFSGLEKISLYNYEKRVMSIDPRNDGYAQKANALFVQNGKRLIYIPVNEIGFLVGGEMGLRQKIQQALGDIPVLGIDFKRSNHDSTIFYILFVIGGALSVFFILKLKRRVQNVIIFASSLPSLLLLITNGPAGFAASAVLICFFQFYSSIIEYLSVNALKKRISVYDFYCLTGKTLRQNIIIASGFLLLFFAVSIIGGSGFFSALVSLLCYCASTFVLWRMFNTDSTHTENVHRPFKKVNIFVKAGYKANYRAVFVWSFFAFIGLLVSFIATFGQNSEQSLHISYKNDSKSELSSADYENHIAFQQNFSYQNLNQSPSIEGNSSIGGHTIKSANYLHYTTDEIGLFNENDSTDAKNEPTREGLEPFHLNGLIKFLQSDTIFTAPSSNLSELFAALVSLLLYAIIVIIKKHETVFIQQRRNNF
ncbi:MAG: hypothetical protein Ta2G_13250 [Termitinemataceae bacterium]|nr:MAG: hypothetical protein Ta2G_13250 [Termitinemataceae bacterium]